jgi:hypothetical protein
MEIVNTTFDNITTSAPPGSGLRLHMLVVNHGDDYDTVTVRNSTFTNIHGVLGDTVSLDLIHTQMVYTGSTPIRNSTMQHCQFVNITAALLAALEVGDFTVDNCTVNSVRLAYGGFAIMSQKEQRSLYQQVADFVNSTFSNIQLGSALDATALDQDFFPLVPAW